MIAATVLALVAAAGVSAQAPAAGPTPTVNPALPPAACPACLAVITAVQTCQSNAAPAAASEWQTALTTMAKCICPFLKGANADTCAECLTLNDFGSPATTLYSQLKGDCFNSQSKTIVDLGTVWNITVNGDGNATTPSTGVLGPTTTPKSGAAPGTSALSTVALWLVGVVSAVVPAALVL
eukprot:jgi/Hompol1/3041/HPOL_006350-RA